MERFVIRENVTLRSERFVASVDPHHRNEVKSLLIEEEDKFARRSERLAEVAGRINQCHQRTAGLEALIAGSKSNGHVVARHEQVLANFHEVVGVCEDYHRVLPNASARWAIG